MPGLDEGFPIEEILLIEVDLRQILSAHLYFDATGGAGGVPTTIVVQPTPEQLRRLQQRGIDLNLSTIALRK
jgi:hypothetical protein